MPCWGGRFCFCLVGCAHVCHRRVLVPTVPHGGFGVNCHCSLSHAEITVFGVSGISIWESMYVYKEG